MSKIDVRPPSAAERVGSSAIRDLLALTHRPDVISLAGGMPAPEGFPVGAIGEAVATVLARDAGALQYSVTEGEPELRAWIAQQHGVTPDQVLVTHGSQQALDLVARTLLPAGAVVALADPAYVGALQVLRLAGAELMSVASDAHGLRVDELGAALVDGPQIDAVYVVPNFDNPTGATLPDERRRHLMELAERHDFLVIEDDPYRELRFAGVTPRPLADHAREVGATPRLVSLGSFSKVLAPGLRVGYAIATPDLVAELAIIKQAADLHTSTFGQRVVAEVLARPSFLDEHVAQLRARYRVQAEALTDALDRRLAGRVHFVTPEGGMFVWAEIDGVTDSDALLAAALEHGVAFVPGSAFAVDRGSRAGLRLSFATAAPAALDDAVARLALAVPRLG